MAMIINKLLHLLTFALLSTLSLSSSNPPEYSPSPSPSPPPQSGSDESSIASVTSSSPPPSNLSPDRSPSPSPSSPFEASDASTAEVESEDPNDELSSSAGMSGGKKVGIAVGLMAAACFVGFGGVLYRKRRENIRRARYSQSARLEFF